LGCHESKKRRIFGKFMFLSDALLKRRLRGRYAFFIAERVSAQEGSEESSEK
jgi:hypothetical protein